MRKKTFVKSDADADAIRLDSRQTRLNTNVNADNYNENIQGSKNMDDYDENFMNMNLNVTRVLNEARLACK